jgi:hypothetical protein
VIPGSAATFTGSAVFWDITRRRAVIVVTLVIIQHITAACEQLAPTEYIKRHDEVAKVIHQKLAEAAELTEDKCPYYRYKPANVLENDSFKLYWNRSIITDRTVPSTRRDITLTYKKTKNTFLIDIAIPNTISPKQ